jgi:hypothetical protein
VQRVARENGLLVDIEVRVVRESEYSAALQLRRHTLPLRLPGVPSWRPHQAERDGASDHGRLPLLVELGNATMRRTRALVMPASH